MSDPVSVLVVAHQTAANGALLETVHERAQHGPVRFHMVVPRRPHGMHKMVDPVEAGDREAHSFGDSILLYELYQNGEETDAYVSAPHEGLELDGAAQEGSPTALCAAFGIQMEHKVKRVERILRTPTRPGAEFAYAANRHGELCKALGLPVTHVAAKEREPSGV